MDWSRLKRDSCRGVAVALSGRNDGSADSCPPGFSAIHPRTVSAGPWKWGHRLGCRGHEIRFCLDQFFRARLPRAIARPRVRSGRPLDDSPESGVGCCDQRPAQLLRFGRRDDRGIGAVNDDLAQSLPVRVLQARHGYHENDPPLSRCHPPSRGNFGLAGKPLRAWKARASLRTPGSAETTEQRRQPCRRVCTG